MDGNEEAPHGILLAALDQSGSAPPDRHEAQGENLPLSYAQQQLWFLDRLEPGSSVYNLCQAVRLTGALNLTALERSLNEIIRRHEVLRANFIASDGNPAQTIAGNRTLKLQVTDLSRAHGERRGNPPAVAGAFFRLAQGRALWYPITRCLPVPIRYSDSFGDDGLLRIQRARSSR